MKITYEDHFGSDLDIVNAARVSFAKKSDWVETCECGVVYDPNAKYNKWPGCGADMRECPKNVTLSLSEKDKRLIQYLARGCTKDEWSDIKIDIATLGHLWMRTEDDHYENELETYINDIRDLPTHWSPFAQCDIRLHMKVPIFVARQLDKHQVGFVKSEVSRRYVDSEPEIYFPEEWRERSKDKKQGSGGPIKEFPEYSNGELAFPLDQLVAIQMQNAVTHYNWLIEEGVAPEQARMVLPQAMYTEYKWKGSLYGWANLYKQRIRSDVQKETQEVARQIGEIIAPLFPVSWEALTKR